MANGYGEEILAPPSGSIILPTVRCLLKRHGTPNPPQHKLLPCAKRIPVLVQVVAGGGHLRSFSDRLFMTFPTGHPSVTELIWRQDRRWVLPDHHCMTAFKKGQIKLPKRPNWQNSRRIGHYLWNMWMTKKTKPAKFSCIILQD